MLKVRRELRTKQCVQKSPKQCDFTSSLVDKGGKKNANDIKKKSDIESEINRLSNKIKRIP